MKEGKFFKKLGLGKKDKGHGDSSTPISGNNSEEAPQLSPSPVSPALISSSPAPPSSGDTFSSGQEASAVQEALATLPVSMQPPSAPTPKDAAAALRATASDTDEVFEEIQKEVAEAEAKKVEAKLATLASASGRSEKAPLLTPAALPALVPSATPDSNGTGDDFTQMEATLKLEEGDSIKDKLSVHLDKAIDAAQWLFGVGGYTMTQEILRWSMLTQIVGAVVITYLMASFHIWAVVTVPLMIGSIWLIWAVHLKSVTTVIQTQTRLEFILSGMMPEKESAWWLNMVMRACWPIFLRDFLNRVVVPKLAPWFLMKYKPPVLLRVDVLGVDMGDRGPVVSNVRVLQGVAGDSHVELEMDLEVASADNMFIHCGAKVVGMSAITWEAYVNSMHLTGTVRVGLKFTNNWQCGFVERVAVMFPSPPQLSCAIRVSSMGGLDAASMPLVAGYVEATLQAALNAALCWPNRILVVDAIKAVCFLLDLPTPEHDETETSLEVSAGGAKAVKLAKALVGQQAATAVVEILEGEDLVAADSGGTSDPYVKGTLGPGRFTTGVIHKTLNPKWVGEKYEMPVEDWTKEESYKLTLKVRDYDKFSSDDDLGWVSLDLRQFRGGIPQEQWLDLQDVETGTLLVKVTIKDDIGLTEEEKQQLLEEKKAQETQRAKKLAGLLGKIDKDAADAAAGMLGSLEAFDPKSAANQAGNLMLRKYKKTTESLVRKHGFPKALVGGDVAAVVEVQVVEGQNLMAADKGGTSDPYVKASLGRSKFTTQVVYKTLNPKWLEKHTLSIKKWPEPGEKCCIKFDVFDRDRAVKDDFLGSVEVDLVQYKDGNEHELMLPLTKTKTGTIRVTLKVIDLDAAAEDAPSAVSAADSLASSTRPSDSQREAAESQWMKNNTLIPTPAGVPGKKGDDYSQPGVLIANKTPAGVTASRTKDVATGPGQGPPKSFVKVEVLEAQDLEAKDLSGTSDPFVKGTIGAVQFSTKPVNKTLNPCWNDSFKIPIVEWHSESTVLTIEVFDKNTLTSSANIGRCIINLNRFRDGMRHDLWLRLENAKSGKIRIAVTDLDDALEVRSEILEVIPGVVVESWKVQSEQIKGKQLAA